MWRFGLMVGVVAGVLAGGMAYGQSLIKAVEAGDAAAVAAALEAGEEPDRRLPPFLMTPLTVATARGQTEIVRLMLDRGGDPDIRVLQGANALAVAVRSCAAGMDLVDLLIAAEADLENRSGNGLTPLLIAVQDNRTELALHLIEAGADARALTPFGDGVLNFAIYNKNPVLVQAALRNGAGTDQLNQLFTTVEYDPPGYHDATGHHAGICG